MIETGTERVCASRLFATFALVLLVAPAAFMAATPPARAATPVTEVGPVEGFISGILGQSTITAVKEAYTAVKAAITSIAAVTSAAKETALVIERYVLQPLAYITTGNLLKKITSSILGFIGGKNALGKPLYDQNTRSFIQNVGDVEAYSFLAQFQKNSNSPFASAITSSLRANYLQGSSLAGFFAANKSTLSTYSSDPKNFAAGNWSLGGWAAWFGLTTVDQNNPYTAYYLASDQLNRQVQTAQSAKLAEVNRNQGYLNWCGTQGGTTAGGGGTTYDTNGNPTNVTNTDEFKAVAGGDCQDFDINGNCIGNGTPTGNPIPLDDWGDTNSCPAETVRAGNGCACTNANGCGTADDGSTEWPANSFVLPTGYTCQQGTTFDGDSGGCRDVNTGQLTYALNANGDPAVTPSNLDAPPNDNNKTVGPAGPGSASAQQTLSALQKESLFRSGTDNYGGNCGIAVRTALCTTDGGTFCNGLGNGGAGNWASVATPAGWAKSQTVVGVGSNSGLSSYGLTFGGGAPTGLQDGDVVQTLPIGAHSYGHVCYMYGGSCYSDTKQTNIVPYADSRNSSNLQVVVWRGPSKTSLGTQHTQVAAAYAAIPSHTGVAHKAASTVAAKPSFLGWVGDGLSYVWHLLPFTGPQLAVGNSDLLAAAATPANTIYLNPGLTTYQTVPQQVADVQKQFPGYTVIPTIPGPEITSVTTNCAAVPSKATVVTYSAGGSCLAGQMNTCSDCDFILVDANNNSGALGAVTSYSQAHPSSVQIQCTSGYGSDICNSSSLTVATCSGSHDQALTSCGIAAADPGYVTIVDNPSPPAESDYGGGDPNTAPTTAPPTTAPPTNTGSPDFSGYDPGPTNNPYSNSSSVAGVKPGDPCTKSDGTAGRVQTPGSTLKDYLSNTLKASGLDKLVQGAGDLSTQINSIMGDIGTVMKAVDMATNLFGGSSSGLLAFSGNSAYTSPFASYLNSSTYMGLTTQTVYQNAQTSGVSSSVDLANNVAGYQASWNTIGAAATTASTNLNKIITTCSSQAAAAQTALATWVTPTLQNWALAQAAIASANALIAKAATDATSNTDDGAYSADIQLMATASPTATDVASIAAEADPLSTAIATPTGSLSITGGVTIDRLNLINTNAALILSSPTSCPAAPNDASSTPPT